MSLTQIQIPYKLGYDFGVGSDFISNSPMNQAVIANFSGVEGALGATVNYEISRISSTSDLETKLDINAEASYGSPTFNGVSARFNFAKSCKIQSSSLFMAITANVQLAFESIDSPTLTPEAAKLTDHPDIFAARYGNMFVRGVGRGGLFVGVLQIDTSSSTDSESISSRLEGSYGLFSATAKQNFESIQHDFHSEITIKVYHEGGPVDLLMNDITDPNQFYDLLQIWLKSFVDHPDQNAKPYAITLAPMAIASGPIPPNAADIQHAQDILQLCAKQRSNILDGLNLMDHIIQNPSRYDFVVPTTREEVIKAFKGYQADLDLVAASASLAINDVAKALTPADYASQLQKNYPQGIPPSPLPTLKKGLMDVYAANGQVIANADPLLTAIRDTQPEGDCRKGFDIGLGVWKNQTLDGPGKQSILQSLSIEQQVGFREAGEVSRQRNNNADLAAKGEIIVLADPVLLAAREHGPASTYWLGFDIATGIFGDPALGALGNTQMGPGSEKIRSSLDLDGQSGFNAAFTILLSRSHAK